MRRGYARWIGRTLLAVGLTCSTADTLQAQSGVIDRTMDRIARLIEGAVARVSGAANPGQEGQQVAASGPAEGFRWSGRIARGGALEVKGVNGAIFVERADGDEALVVTEARGRRSDPATVRIEVVEHAGGVTLCAVYPSGDDEGANACAPGSGGRMNVERNDVEVEFRVRVPEGVPFLGRTVNGDIEAVDLASDVRVATVNGDVDVLTAGAAEAETVNGSIDVEMGGPPPDGGLSFSTVNGTIDLDLPDDVDAELDARWLNGDLESDLPILLGGRMGRRSARGTLGDGGPRLELSTVNGSIRIR